MKRLNIYITDYQAKEMEKIKKKIDLKPSEVIRRALDEYIDKIKKKLKIRKILCSLCIG